MDDAEGLRTGPIEFSNACVSILNPWDSMVVLLTHPIPSSLSSAVRMVFRAMRIRRVPWISNSHARAFEQCHHLRASSVSRPAPNFFRPIGYCVLISLLRSDGGLFPSLVRQSSLYVDGRANGARDPRPGTNS